MLLGLIPCYSLRILHHGAWCFESMSWLILRANFIVSPIFNPSSAGDFLAQLKSWRLSLKAGDLTSMNVSIDICGLPFE